MEESWILQQWRDLDGVGKMRRIINRWTGRGWDGRYTGVVPRLADPPSAFSASRRSVGVLRAGACVYLLACHTRLTLLVCLPLLAKGLCLTCFGRYDCLKWNIHTGSQCRAKATAHTYTWAPAYVPTYVAVSSPLNKPYFVAFLSI